MCTSGVKWRAISDAFLWDCHPATRSSWDNCAYVWTLPVIPDSREVTTTSMSASMTTWMCSALTMKTQCQKIRPNVMFCTWWTLMATAPVITLPKGSRGGSAIGHIPQMDHWSSQKSSSSSRPSHWDLSSGQDGSISTSVSIERFTCCTAGVRNPAIFHLYSVKIKRDKRYIMQMCYSERRLKLSPDILSRNLASENDIFSHEIACQPVHWTIADF